MIERRNTPQIVVVFFLFIVICILIVISSVFFSSKKERSSMRVSTNEDYVSHKGYQYVRFNPSSESAYYDIISYPNLGESEYKFFEEDESLVLISEIGSTEYICYGVCYCETEEEFQRRYSSIPYLSKELMCMVGVVSAFAAYNFAKEYFDSECQHGVFDDSDCHVSGMYSEVTDCEEVSMEAKGKIPLEEGKFYTVDDLLRLGYVEESDVKRKKQMEQEPPPDIGDGTIVYTDGCCVDNGRENARGGIGVYFGSMEDPRNIARRLPGELQTNNRAELVAILDALQSVEDDEDIEIRSDSEYSIKVVTGVWKAKTNLDLVGAIKMKIIDRKLKDAETTFVKVKGHTGDKDGNYYADLLSKQGAEM